MLRTLLVLIVLSVGLVGALKNRFAALLLYIWYALFRPQDWVYFDLEAAHLSLVIGALFVIPSLATGVFPALAHPLSLGALLFLGTGLLAQLSAVNADVGWLWLNQFARLILISLLATTMLSTRRRYVMLVTVTAASLGFYCAKAGLVWLAGGGPHFADGLTGSFADNNGYATGTVMIMPLLVAAGQNATRRVFKWGFYLAAFLSVFTVIGTYSRGGFLALVTIAVTFVLVQRRRRVLTLVTISVLTYAVLAFAPFSQAYFDRLQTIETYNEVGDASALGRLHFWEVAVDMARDRPLGVGVMNYNYAYDRYDSTGGAFGHNRAVHSSHFQVLAENGWAGAFLWVALFVVAFALALRVRFRSRHPSLSPEDARFLYTTANALIVSMAAFLVAGAFIALALNDLTWLTFGLVAALDRLSTRMIRGEAVSEPAAAQAVAA